MPFFGNDFFEATSGYSDSIVLGYLRACWHYWHQTHCEGLPNDNDYLRRICRLDAATWPKAKTVIFGQFFKLSNGLWHQARCHQEHLLSLQSYRKKVKSAAHARSKKRLEINVETKLEINPDSKVRDNPVSTVESNLQSESESEPEPRTEVHTHTGDANIPTLEEVIRLADMRGITIESATSFFNHHQDNSLWINQHGRLIKWESKLVNWGVKDREKHSPTKTDPQRGERIELKVIQP